VTKKKDLPGNIVNCNTQKFGNVVITDQKAIIVLPLLANAAEQ